jgi:hypothetical protein
MRVFAQVRVQVAEMFSFCWSVMPLHELSEDAVAYHLVFVPAVCHSKCNTFFNEVGRVGETVSFLNRQEVEGGRWDITNSPKAKDTPWRA